MYSYVVKQVDERIKSANLSMLLKLMKWTMGLKTELLELKKNVTQAGTVFHGITLQGSPQRVRSDIDGTIDFINNYEDKLECELRKPNKTWNYPAKNV